MKIWILNGVNLNMLGKRPASHYGFGTIKDLRELCYEASKEIGVDAAFHQTNCEMEYIDHIHAACDHDIDGLILNPGAWTHYSYAIRDAAEIYSQFGQIAEVHISDIKSRECFRKVSVLDGISNHQIIGKGFEGYIEAMKMLSSK